MLERGDQWKRPSQILVVVHQHEGQLADRSAEVGQGSTIPSLDLLGEDIVPTRCAETSALEMPMKQSPTA